MIEHYVEALAKSLHRGAGLDNQSTTTVGFNFNNQTLYITHQGNRDYREVLERPARPAWRLLLPEEDGTARDRLIPAAPELRLQRRDYGLGGNFKKIERHERITHWMMGAEADLKDLPHFDPEHFQRFVEDVSHVKVVRDADLFSMRGVSLSGLHGESRIIRYHLLKFIRNFEPLDFEALDGKAPKEVIKALRKEFKQLYARKLVIASSQGACSYCAEFMKKWKVAFASTQNVKKDRDGMWLHPVTMTTHDKGYGFPATTALRVDQTGKRVQEQRDARNASAAGSASGSGAAAAASSSSGSRAAAAASNAPSSSAAAAASSASSVKSAPGGDGASMDE